MVRRWFLLAYSSLLLLLLRVEGYYCVSKRQRVVEDGGSASAFPDVVCWL